VIDMPKRIVKRRSKKSGLPPGTLVYVGDKKGTNSQITLFDYDANQCAVKELSRAEECAAFKGTPTVTWINVDGLQQIDKLERIGQIFGLHSLVMEDILNTDQRPKVEDHGDYLYVVMKMLSYDAERQEINIEQLSLVLGADFLLTFQDKPGDVLDAVRERIRQAKGRIRKLGADYLLYALMDAVVDNYFVVLERLGDKVEQAEEIVTVNPRQDTLQMIHRLKSEMIFLRKAVWPLREVTAGLLRDESGLVNEATGIYLRDLADHLIQIADSVDAYRDLLANMQDVYISTISNRTNGVMKVLTLFSAIFMPLTFITGIFGMNFKHFPELDWYYGLPATVLVMLLLGLAMLWYFKRKKWL
jgi:magnesium transporter